MPSTPFCAIIQLVHTRWSLDDGAPVRAEAFEYIKRFYNPVQWHANPK